MGVEIDALELRVSTSSRSATENLEKLTKSMDKLKKRCDSLSVLTEVARGLDNISYASSLINVEGLTQTASALKILSKVKFSESIGLQIKEFVKSLRELSSVDYATRESLSQLANTLTAFNAVRGKNISDALSQLERIPQITDAIKNTNLDDFTAEINRLADAVKPLANEMEKIANGFASIPKSFKNSTLKESNSFSKTGSFMERIAKKIFSFYTLRIISRGIESAIDKSNEYTEAMNLFTVSMGNYAKSAQDYAERVSDVMGIDTATWLKSQGTFMTLATGFGVAEKRAAKMSQQLTQLGYDLSSFFNISVEDAMQKLQSGISGELEPLRRLGYDLSQARLEAEALALGIDKSVSSMTQAEKAQLRYYAIMTQVTTAQGDMARTLDAPANQLRVLRAQFEQAARSIGNVFIPILNKVLPYVIAFFDVLKEVADVIALLAGWELQDVDYSNVQKSSSGLADNMKDTVDSAKELKKTILGIDELNVMNGAASAAGSESITGSDFDFELPEYDFISEATESRAKSIADRMKEWLGITGEIKSWSDLEETRLGSILKIIKTIIGVLAVSKLIKIGKAASGIWKGIKNIFSGLALSFDSAFSATGSVASGVGQVFKDMGGKIKDAWNNMSKFKKGLIGTAGVVAGMALASKGAKDLVKALNSDTKEGLGGSIAELVGGVGASAAGGAAIGGPIGAVIGGMIGLVTAAQSAHDAAYDLSVQLAEKTAFAEYGKSIELLKIELEESFSAIDEYTKKQQELSEKINAAKDSANQAKEKLNALFDDLENRDEISHEDVDELKTAFDELYSSVQTLNDGRFEKVMSSLSSSITTGLAPGMNALEGMRTEFLELQSAFRIDASSLQAEAASIMAELDAGGLSTKKQKEYKDRLKQIADELGVYAYTEDTSKIKFEGEIGKGINLGQSDNAASQNIAGMRNSLSERLNAIDQTRVSNIGSIREMEYIANERGIDTGIDFDAAEKAVTEQSARQAYEALKAYENAMHQIYNSLNKRFWGSYNDTKNNLIKTVQNNPFFASLEGITGPSLFQSWDDWYDKEAKKRVTEAMTNSISAYNAERTWLLDESAKYGYSISLPTWKPYASGGFPTTGSLFLANEAGPELVGTIGHKNAVVNQGQIIQGISVGVTNANAESNALLREQNMLLRKILEKGGNGGAAGLTVVKDDRLLRTMSRRNRRDGRATFSVGV